MDSTDNGQKSELESKRRITRLSRARGQGQVQSLPLSLSVVTPVQKNVATSIPSKAKDDTPVSTTQDISSSSESKTTSSNVTSHQQVTAASGQFLSSSLPTPKTNTELENGLSQGDSTKTTKTGSKILTTYVDEETGRIKLFQTGLRLEVEDVKSPDVWYSAKVVKVDTWKEEVRVHYENWSSRYDEWIEMDSCRLRPGPGPKTNAVIMKFTVNERVEAYWAANGDRYPGIIQSILPNDRYQILFDDGIQLKKKYDKIFKVSSKAEGQTAAVETSPEPEPEPTKCIIPALVQELGTKIQAVVTPTRTPFRSLRSGSYVQLSSAPSAIKKPNPEKTKRKGKGKGDAESKHENHDTEKSEIESKPNPIPVIVNADAITPITADSKVEEPSILEVPPVVAVVKTPGTPSKRRRTIQDYSALLNPTEEEQFISPAERVITRASRRLNPTHGPGQSEPSPANSTTKFMEKEQALTLDESLKIEPIEQNVSKEIPEGKSKKRTLKKSEEVPEKLAEFEKIKTEPVDSTETTEEFPQRRMSQRRKSQSKAMAMTIADKIIEKKGQGSVSATVGKKSSSKKSGPPVLKLERPVPTTMTTIRNSSDLLKRTKNSNISPLSPQVKVCGTPTVRKTVLLPMQRTRKTSGGPSSGSTPCYKYICPDVPLGNFHPEKIQYEDSESDTEELWDLDGCRPAAPPPKKIPIVKPVKPIPGKMPIMPKSQVPMPRSKVTPVKDIAPDSSISKKKKSYSGASRKWKLRQKKAQEVKAKLQEKVETDNVTKPSESEPKPILDGISAGRMDKIKKKLYEGSVRYKLAGDTVSTDVSVDIIRCFCPVKFEHGLMVQCEVCQTWQHGSCYSIDYVEQLPPFYTCSNCQEPFFQNDMKRTDWHYEFRKTSTLPRFSFAPPLDPNIDRVVRGGNEIIGRLHSVREMIHSTHVKISVVAAAENKPKPKDGIYDDCKYEPTKDGPTPAEQLQKRKFNKVYRPVLKRLLNAKAKDGGDVEEYKVYLRNKVEERIKMREEERQKTFEENEQTLETETEVVETLETEELVEPEETAAATSAIAEILGELEAGTEDSDIVILGIPDPLIEETVLPTLDSSENALVDLGIDLGLENSDKTVDLDLDANFLEGFDLTAAKSSDDSELLSILEDFGEQIEVEDEPVVDPEIAKQIALRAVAKEQDLVDEHLDAIEKDIIAEMEATYNDQISQEDELSLVFDANDLEFIAKALKCLLDQAIYEEQMKMQETNNGEDNVEPNH